MNWLERLISRRQLDRDLSDEIGQHLEERANALGASRNVVLAMVLKQAMFLVAAGIALGVAGAIAAGQVLTNMLYGVSPRNPLLLTIACCAIIPTAALAAFLPAHRAAYIDPMQALRSE